MKRGHLIYVWVVKCSKCGREWPQTDARIEIHCACGVQKELIKRYVKVERYA